jgi:YfiH family protein
MRPCFKDEHHVYRFGALAAFEWLDHGFGTRHSEAFNALDAATLKQVHSDRVLAAMDGPGCVGEGDALITDRAGVRLAVRTADCVPVLLADARLRVVAAVHAGWRGTLAAISRKTVERMRDAYGSEPADIHAAIGPGIGVCCFEVGREVAALFRAEVEGKIHLDLPALNRAQLLEAGLGSGRIHVAELCTRCDTAEFHSFRRDRERAGRLVSSVLVRG